MQPERKRVTLPAATLEAYVGRYKGPNAFAVIKREGDVLIADSAVFQSALRLRPISETVFFDKMGEYMFYRGPDGKVAYYRPGINASSTGTRIAPALTMTSFAFCAFGISLLTSLLLAQEPFRVGVRLVTVTAVVTDTTGRYVRNLKAEDFSVQEDGVPQKIAFFRHNPDAPLSVGIVFDLRNTMKKKMKAAAYAVDLFRPPSPQHRFDFPSHVR